jgi:hypothetical protein
MCRTSGVFSFLHRTPSRWNVVEKVGFGSFSGWWMRAIRGSGFPLGIAMAEVAFRVRVAHEGGLRVWQSTRGRAVVVRCNDAVQAT